MNSEEFSNQVKQLAKRIETLVTSIQTEEATKMSFIIPFFQTLGYEVFNPEEFIPEFTADVGIKKGEKVDYAIIINNIPTILIEAKWCGESLDKYNSQLFRYFGTTKAKFAILTNGINYKFYTDLDEMNKMDEKPFLDINLFDLKDRHIIELKKFCKDSFDLTTIMSSASELKYTNMIKQKLSLEFNNPSDALVKTLITDVYEGVKTQKVIDEFKIIVKKSFSYYINDLINDRLKIALDSQKQTNEQSNKESINQNTKEVKLVKKMITEEELESYYTIKSILTNIIPIEKINYKNTQYYLAILFEKNIRKWICRVKIREKTKSLLLPSADNTIVSINIESIGDFYKHKNSIIQSASRFLK